MLQIQAWADLGWGHQGESCIGACPGAGLSPPGQQPRATLMVTLLSFLKIDWMVVVVVVMIFGYQLGEKL